jgi:ZIP family zinc transporter
LNGPSKKIVLIPGGLLVTNSILLFVLLAAGTWLAAALGSSMIAFVKRGKGTSLIMGFAAGVILMVSFVELIHPAIHSAESHAALPAWFVVPVSFAVGFLAVLGIDIFITRLKERSEARGMDGFKYRQGLLLIGALSAHSIPEGLALGILLGAVGHSLYSSELLVLVPIVAAVGAHKIPEGTAISAAFQAGGMSKLKSFVLGQASGFFAFLFGVAGFFIATGIDAFLPYVMSFAGGAMVWVATHELIPKSQVKDKPYLATIGVLLGVVLMLIIDTTLHQHSHGIYHCCSSHH